MFTFLGIIGLIITILVALPASLIAFATFIEHPIKAVIALWTNLVLAYKDLWESITK
jgi:hypothetical protein